MLSIVGRDIKTSVLPIHVGDTDEVIALRVGLDEQSRLQAYRGDDMGMLMGQEEINVVKRFEFDDVSRRRDSRNSTVKISESRIVAEAMILKRLIIAARKIKPVNEFLATKRVYRIERHATAFTNVVRFAFARRGAVAKCQFQTIPRRIGDERFTGRAASRESRRTIFCGEESFVKRKTIRIKRGTAVNVVTNKSAVNFGRGSIIAMRRRR